MPQRPSAVDTFEEVEFAALGYAVTRLYDQLNLEDQDFQSPEEAHQFLETLRHIAREIKEKSRWATALRQHWPESQCQWPDVFLSEVAQMLLAGLYDNFGNLRADIAQVTATAQYALRLDNECVEACRVIGVAHEQSGDLNQALTAFQRAAQIGWKSISEEARRRLTADKAWWSDFTTRDYMRAEADLARLRWKRQQYAEALRGYRKLLRLNPGDNQGIRYCLLCCALEAGDWAAAEKIFAQYLRDEENAISLYSRALLAFVKQDDQPDARAALLAAFAANAHVPELLLTGGDDLLALPLGPYSHGSQMEALMYFQMAVKSWRQQPHAFAWLRRAARKSTLLK